ncbi:MAG TPA: hypothetical protein VK086_02660 [Ruania sp.]|nr:hypothetical protein [Ruania sp.]
MRSSAFPVRKRSNSAGSSISAGSRWIFHPCAFLGRPPAQQLFLNADLAGNLGDHSPGIDHQEVHQTGSSPEV